MSVVYRHGGPLRGPKGERPWVLAARARDNLPPLRRKPLRLRSPHYYLTQKIESDEIEQNDRDEKFERDLIVEEKLAKLVEGEVEFVTTERWLIIFCDVADCMRVLQIIQQAQ
jgi:hypothetical protein